MLTYQIFHPIECWSFQGYDISKQVLHCNYSQYTSAMDSPLFVIDDWNFICYGHGARLLSERWPISFTNIHQHTSPDELKVNLTLALWPSLTKYVFPDNLIFLADNICGIRNSNALRFGST